jgi:hypothetical protein
MKGIHGLILAIVLGIAGALFNFAYLANRSRDVEKVAFIGVKEDKIVGRGEPLIEESLEPVEIPRRWMGKLEDYAVLWSARQTVLGRRVWRALEGGSLVLRADLKTPPRELVFGVNLPQSIEERAVGVPIDTRKFVPSLVQPGDLVSFIVSATRGESPTPADDPAKAAAPGKADPKGTPAVAASRPQSRDTVDVCGPFKVLSIGNRLGSYDVMLAARISQTQENVMIILVKIENGKMEPEAARLMRIIEGANSKPLGYLLHPRNQKQE